MKKKIKVKSTKKTSVKRAKTAEPVMPGLVEAMAKLVERLETVERKMDQVLGRVSNLPSEVRNAVGQLQRAYPSQALPVSRVEFRPGGGANPEVRRERVLYQAVCADCQKRCEVPFKPGDRPVYCKECFAIRKSGHVPQDPDRRIPVAEQKKKATYIPSALGENAIPTILENVSSFSRKKQKPTLKKALKAGKKRK